MRVLRTLAAALLIVAAPVMALAQIPGPGVVQYQGAGGGSVPVSSGTPLPVTGTFSASLGGFTPATRGTPVSVTTADSSGTLPSGAVVVVSNVGANPMYCNVNGAAATTADQLITASGGWFAFTIPGGQTALHCIATGGSTTANMLGGAGLPTGTGGGSGGGSSSNASVSATGSAVPTSATYIGIITGGNLTGWTGAVTNAGTFSTQLTGATNNINNITGTVSLPTGAANAVAIASTTSGQTGSLVQCAVTTAAPAYTTAQTDPLSCDTAGNLRVSGTGVAQGSTTSGQTGSLIMGAVTTASPTYTTAQTSPLSLDTAGSLRVAIISGAGSGGTAIADKGAWTVSSTNFTLSGGEFTTGNATACATAQACTVGMTASRGFFQDMNTWAETSLGAPTPYGTAPSTGNYIGVNAFVTNATPGIANNADAIASVAASSSSPVPVNNYNYVYNGTTWDRSRSGTTTGSTLVNGAGTAGTASGGVLTVQGVASMTPLLATVSQATGTNLHMVCDSGCSGSGGTSSNFGSAFPTAGTAIGLTTGTNMLAWSATSNYGSSPGAIAVPSVNAAVTNTVAANLAQVNGVTTLTGTGATGTGAQRVTVSTDQATNAGAALVKGGVGVVNGGSTYQAVAASQTATVLQSSTGAAGDYLSHCDIYPTSTSPGVVTVFDNTNTAATSVVLFGGGATSLSSLAPIPVPVGAVSSAGAWKVTTGASVSVVCYGKFS